MASFRLLVKRIEFLGPINDTACSFLSGLARMISAQSGDDVSEDLLLFLRTSAYIHHFTTILFHNSFEGGKPGPIEQPDYWSLQDLSLTILFFLVCEWPRFCLGQFKNEILIIWSLKWVLWPVFEMHGN